MLISLSILCSCSGTRDALVGKKRSDSSDEFLIKKKNPLVLPPDYDEMPVPIGEENIILNEQENENIKKILTDNQKKPEIDNSDNNSLEESILEKINN